MDAEKEIELMETLKRLEAKIDLLVEPKRRIVGHPDYQKLTYNQQQVIISLPSHLQKTAIALITLGVVDAPIVSSHTHRARAIESGYLNQLVNMGLATKLRVMKKMNFAWKYENPSDK